MCIRDRDLVPSGAPSQLIGKDRCGMPSCTSEDSLPSFPAIAPFTNDSDFKIKPIFASPFRMRLFVDVVNNLSLIHI